MTEIVTGEFEGLSTQSDIAETVCEILERDSRRYSGFRETEAEA